MVFEFWDNPWADLDEDDRERIRQQKVKLWRGTCAGNLTRARARATGEEGKMIRCSGCPREFGDEDAYWQHIEAEKIQRATKKKSWTQVCLEPPEMKVTQWKTEQKHKTEKWSAEKAREVDTGKKDTGKKQTRSRDSRQRPRDSRDRARGSGIPPRSDQGRGSGARSVPRSNQGRGSGARSRSRGDQDRGRWVWLRDDQKVTNRNQMSEALYPPREPDHPPQGRRW
jgi:hypothetical protein